MIVILCRNAFLLIVLNAFEASTSKTASDDWSSYISCIACTSDSHLASCPAQTCNEPNADIISSRMCDTTTLLAIQRKTSPIPIGRSPGFLFNGINLHASNASNDDDRSSVVQSSFMTSANVLHKMYELLPNWSDVKILFQPSASRPEGPAAPLFLSIAFFTLSASIEWNLIGWISSGISGSNTLDEHLYHVGVFIKSDVKFDHLMEEYHFACGLLKASSHYWYYPSTSQE